ncbi:hypothetical protein HGRIS_009351 [Hohenbuehelia grisea]|uniref:Transmembrane protein n=1 Tax=Hohenbuehelia grisea TaxID=104357 RepID=A0ABR3J101_9AGAR
MICFGPARLLSLVCIFVSPLLLAAPTSSDGPSSTVNVSISSRPSGSLLSDAPSRSASVNATRAPARHRSATTRRLPNLPPVATHITFPQDTLPTQRPSRPDRPPPENRERRHPQQNPVAIVFEVIGALAGVALVLSIIRCIYSYRRTPNRDRIAALVERHRLQREMEELERNPRILRPPSFVEPPPPYLPRPPSYISSDHSSRRSSDSSSTSSIGSSTHSRSSSSLSSASGSSIDQTQPLHPNG